MYEVSDLGTVSFSEASNSEENTDLSMSGNVTRCSHSTNNLDTSVSSNMDDLSRKIIPNVEVTQHLQSIMPQDGTTAVQEPKRSLTLIQMILLNSVVCGVEVCACAGFTYIPPMLLKAGYTEENMSILLGMGPFLGLMVVPIIGRASDKCKSRFGRRRPFIAGLSFILVLSLLLIPYGDVLFIKLLGETTFSKSLCLVGLTVGVVLLDFTSQACLTPCEALLSDASKDTHQHEQIFTIYSQMVSCGGFLGYLVTALDWHSMRIGQFFGSQERTVFSLLTVMFLFLFTATIIVAKEEPLSERDVSQSELRLIETEIPELKSAGSSCTLESGYESSINSDDENVYPGQNLLKRHKRHKSVPKSGKKSTQVLPLLLNVLFYPVIFILKRVKAITFLQSCFKSIGGVMYEKLPESLRNLLDIPYVLKNLALANFCSWTALMGFNLFFTDFVGQAVYGGNPNAPENSILRNQYDEGVRIASWGLLFHCITSAIYAFVIERLVVKFGTRWTYFFGMFSFTIAMFSMVMWRNIYVVNIMAAFTGFAYATLTTIPFILITTYHTDKQIFFFDASGNRGIGADMGMLDTAYFLSQVVLSGIMGYIVHITGTVLSYMVTAGVMGVFSCIFVQRIISDKFDLPNIKPHSRERSRILKV